MAALLYTGAGPGRALHGRLRGAAHAREGLPRPLHLEQHRDLLKTSGYDDPPDFANFSSQDVSEMRAAL